MPSLQKILDALNNEWFHIGDWRFSPLGLLRLVVLVAVAVGVAQLVKRALRRLFARNSHIDAGVSNAVVSSIYGVVLVLGLGFALSESGFNLTSIAVFTGAVGVGVGLGLQDFAKNFIAGVIVLITRPAKVGDRIQTGGVEAVVRSIGLYSTVLETLDGSSLILPNSSLLNDRIVNWDYAGAAKRTTVTVKVAVTADLEQATEVMRRAAHSLDNGDSILVQIQSLLPTGIEFAVSVSGHESNAASRDQLARALWAALNKAGIPLATA